MEAAVDVVGVVAGFRVGFDSLVSLRGLVVESVGSGSVTAARGPAVVDRSQAGSIAVVHSLVVTSETGLLAWPTGPCSSHCTQDSCGSLG